jgi:hypothetical protein
MKNFSKETYQGTEAVTTLVQTQRAPYVAPPNISSISNFTVAVNTGGTTGGATASFKLVTSIQGISSIRLLRADTNSFTAASVLQSWSISSVDLNKTFSYVDTSPLLKLKTTFYWVQLIPNATVSASPALTNQTPLYTLGPQTLAQLGAAQLPPTQIQGLNVSLGASNADGTQTLYVNFQAPADPNFSYMRLQVSGFNGDPNPVFLVDAENSPFSFNMIQTGETLTLKGYAVSLTGLVNTTSPATASITLNGSATNPAALFNVTAFKIIGGIQVNFPAGLEPSISLYTIYRSAPGAGSGASTSVGTVTPSGAGSYSFLDTSAVNQEFDYYVKVTDTTGTSGFSNVALLIGVGDHRGNLKFSVTDGFSYTATTSSITWSWTGLTIFRSDNTTTVVPDSSQAITGLSPTTPYTFFPYWDEISQTLLWVTVGTATGSPAYAYTAANAGNLQLQSQELLSHISLAAGGMSASTTTSGGGGGTGGGGGGGGGGCFSGNVPIKTPSGFIRFDELPGVFLVENLTGTHTADLLVHEGYEDTLIDMGEGLLVTQGHLMKVGEAQWLPASEVFPIASRVSFKGTVYNLHVRTAEPADQHYILENGEIAHNVKREGL